MTEQYIPNLGQEPDETARRDAVHIAVCSVVAAHPLWVGEAVGLNRKGEAIAPGPYNLSKEIELIGIVDPFLGHGERVEKGGRFWLFLYPGTITSLRHVWSHPSFKVGLSNE